MKTNKLITNIEKNEIERISWDSYLIYIDPDNALNPNNEESISTALKLALCPICHGNIKDWNDSFVCYECENSVCERCFNKNRKSECMICKSRFYMHKKFSRIEVEFLLGIKYKCSVEMCLGKVMKHNDYI